MSLYKTCKVARALLHEDVINPRSRARIEWLVRLLSPPGNGPERGTGGRRLPRLGRQLQAQPRLPLRLPSRLQGLLPPSSAVSQVKSSNNNEYRVKPVYGFVDAKATVELEIQRLAGPPKEDKIVVQWAEVPAEEQDPKAPFAAGAQAGEVIVPLKAE